MKKISASECSSSNSEMETMPQVFGGSHSLPEISSGVQPSESSESSSDNESYGSSIEYHDGHSMDTSIKPGSCLSQDYHHSRRNSYAYCSWQQDDMHENSMSLSQPTTNGYLNSHPVIRYPRSLSQEYDQFYGNTNSPWAQYGMYSFRSVPKELDRNINRLSVYRSSSLGTRVMSQQTYFSKKVVTARGEINVTCEAIRVMSELHKGERMVVHRYYHGINEYGTVRALSVTVDNKPWYVGVELDLPGWYTYKYM